MCRTSINTTRSSTCRIDRVRPAPTCRWMNGRRSSRRSPRCTGMMRRSGRRRKITKNDWEITCRMRSSPMVLSIPTDLPRRTLHIRRPRRCAVVSGAEEARMGNTGFLARGDPPERKNHHGSPHCKAGDLPVCFLVTASIQKSASQHIDSQRSDVSLKVQNPPPHACTAGR